MTRFSRSWAAMALFVLVVAFLASTHDGSMAAQTSSAQQSQLLLVTEIQLKPDTAPEWAALQRSDWVPAQKKGGLPWRDTWTTAVAGDAYTRWTVTPIPSLAQFDSPAPVVKALGQESAAALTARNRRLLSGSRNYIALRRPDLGFGTRPADYKLAIFTTVVVASGRGPDFEAFLKSDVVPALKKANVTYYTVAQVIYGGDASMYWTVIPVNDFAELAKGHPLERALGAAGNVKLGQKAGAFVSRLERTILRYLPDLSYRPAAVTSN